MNIRSFSFPARVEKDEAGRYLVTFLDFPEAVTDGETVREAFMEAQDAIAEAIAGRMCRGEEIPTPSEPGKEDMLIPVPPQIAIKAALYGSAREQGLSKSALGHMLGVNEKEARRILDPHHPTKLQRLQKALNQLGQQLVISIEPVPPENTKRHAA